MLILNNKQVASTVKSAKHIDYDNTNSKLEATNIQDAIDEIAEHGGGGGSSEAKNVSYDNTKSQLEIDNVQDMLDFGAFFMSDVPHFLDAEENPEIETPIIDADFFNGHDSTYYAKQSDMDEVKREIQEILSIPIAEEGEF